MGKLKMKAFKKFLQFFLTGAVLTEELGKLIIIVGVLLMFFKIKKVWKYGTAIYFIGLIIEILVSISIGSLN